MTLRHRQRARELNLRQHLVVVCATARLVLIPPGWLLQERQRVVERRPDAVAPGLRHEQRPRRIAVVVARVAGMLCLPLRYFNLEVLDAFGNGLGVRVLFRLARERDRGNEYGSGHPKK